jgi:hypothetical protein
MVINIKKRNILFLTSIFCVFIIGNSVTAIPQKESNIIMDKINKLEDFNISVEDKISDITELLTSNLIDKYPTGFIENLINFLIKLIEFILNIAEFIGTILNLGETILTFINQIIYIIETIINIINWILDLINPQQFNT